MAAAKKKKDDSKNVVTTATGRGLKAGEDARKRAAKYGTVTSKPTKQVHDSSNPITNKRGTLQGYPVTSYTQIKSARGNMYTVAESKNQMDLWRDSKPKTKITPVTPPKKAAPKKKK
jgi:hypothetical protein